MIKLKLNSCKQLGKYIIKRLEYHLKDVRQSSLGLHDIIISSRVRALLLKF